MSANICPQCGVENVEVAWKCKSCGHDLPGALPEEKSAPNYKPLAVILIGLVILAATWVYFNKRYNETAPTENDINRAVLMNNQAGVNLLIQRSQEAEDIKKTSYIVIALEICIIAALAYLVKDTPEIKSIVEKSPLPADIEQQRAEKLGVEVAVCPKCGRVNSLSLLNCESCSTNLEKVKPVRNPYL